MSKTREQRVAALRRQVVAMWVAIVALVVIIAILLAGAALAAGPGETVSAAWAGPQNEAPRAQGPERLTAVMLLAAAEAADELSPVESLGELEPAETVNDDDPVSLLGEFTLYAYCPCKTCCGKWAGGKTASGTMPAAVRTIAVDPEVIALGSLVIIGGVSYIAEDTGKGIDGKTIDIYMDTHAEALEFGVQKAEVWLVR